MARIIQFPGAQEDPSETKVKMPIALFEFDGNGQVDLAEGVSVTDAVVTFWERLQPVVLQTWVDGPVTRERARMRLLTAYLDKVRPGWREELAWTTTE